MLTVRVSTLVVVEFRVVTLMSAKLARLANVDVVATVSPKPSVNPPPTDR